ncbi:MAG: DDE-type integrase/transposase/recombinase [Candidatus Saccharimonadales bacterium]
MAYTSNPYAPRARRDAVSLVLKHGLSSAEAARKTGVHRSTITRWVSKQQKLYLDRRELIPTLSSAPKSHPNALAPELVAEVIRVRLSHNRCAYIVWQELHQAGIAVSLSSVKRTLKRGNLLRRTSQRGRLHPGVKRPPVGAPGDLVQLDTLHFIDWRAGANGQRFYVYTLIDLYSRWAYAEYSPKAKQDVSISFVLRAQAAFGRPFRMVQTDNGPEFGKHFGDVLSNKGINLRHSRIRQANDNAHIERFNRTLQDECLSKYPLPETTPERLTPYLEYYNSARLHLGINCQTPNQLLQRC